MINKDSIKIDGVSIGQYLTGATIGYYKLWSSDSGRNMAGTNTGTLIGIFPKIQLTFRTLTDAELSIILKLVNKSNMTLTYWDTELQQEKSLSCYAGDAETPVKKLGTYQSFRVSIISNAKRV